MRTFIVFSAAFLAFTISIYSQKITYSLPDTINAGDSLTLEISLEKGKITGFAKLELYLPVGFTPLPEKQAGASMVCNNSMVKFIWIDIPAKEIINIRIKMKTDGRLIGKKEFYGSFHYLENGQRKKELLPHALTWIKNKISIVIPETLADIYKKDKTPSETLATVSSGIAYRVQIGAFSRKLSTEILSEFFQPVTMIKEEFTNNLYKYSIGDFTTREKAKEFCNEYGISGAFIVVYKDGKRQ